MAGDSLKCRYIAPTDDGFNFDEYEPEEDAEMLPEAVPIPSPGESTRR